MYYISKLRKKIRNVKYVLTKSEFQELAIILDVLTSPAAQNAGAYVRTSLPGIRVWFRFSG